MTLPSQLAHFGSLLKEFGDEPASVIYFLVDSELDRVVYVGQTNKLALRIASHRRSKAFDRVFYLEVSAKDISAIEDALIGQFRPSYNLAYKGHLRGERLLAQIMDPEQTRHKPDTEFVTRNINATFSREKEGVCD